MATDAPVERKPKLPIPTVETLKRVWAAIVAFFRVPEGWSTFFLVFFLVYVVELSILRAEWAKELSILPSVTFLGLITGFVLARLTFLKNWQAHLIGVAVGIIVIWWRTLSVIDNQFGGVHGKSVELVHRIGRYAKGAWNGAPQDDLFLFVLVMAGLLFFYGYCAMWWTFRSHWLSPTIGVGGLLLLINLGYDRADSGLFLGMFILCAIPLTIRFYAARQEARWNTSRIKYPDSLGWRFLSVSTGLSIALLIFAYSVPFSVHSGPVHTAWERASVPWNDFEGRWEKFFPSIEGRGRTRNTFPGFAAFGDTFQLGGGLNLPPDPALALRCDTIPAEYVKMNTYDFYTGHGFKKKVSDDFKAQQPDGNTYDPRVSLDANKAVPLPPSADQTAKSATCSAELFRPRGNILPIVGAQLEQMNTQTLVSLGWQSFNLTGSSLPPSNPDDLPQPLTDLVQKVSNLQRLSLPVDAPPTLRPGAQGQVTLQKDGTLVIYVPQGSNPNFTPDQLARLVAQTQQQAAAQGGQVPRIYRVTVATAPVVQPSPTAAPAATGSASTPAPTVAPTPTATPQPVVPMDRRFDAITQEQDRLAASLIQTQIVVQGGKVTAILYRGQAPNFNDVDEVISTQPVPVGKEVTENIRVTEATDDMLRKAPSTLPKWTDRYLQLPDGITQRTADLSQQLAKGTTNQFDYATAVEQYLRSNYLYLERINLPPYDRDVTDYFLFTSKQGYCEYFSTAMLVLLRLNGVPTREVVGYLPGARAEDGRLVSSENQAHAWVEVWFPQYGWIPFDPTPRPGVPPIVRGPQILPPAPAAADPADTGDFQGGQDRLDARGEDRLRELDEELGGGFDSNGSYVYQPERHINPLVFIIPLLFGLFVLAVCYVWLRMFRGMTGAAPWYARMTRAVGLAGLTRATMTTTPFEAAAAVAHRLPGSREPAMTIARQFAEERYAGRPGDGAASKSAWMQLRRLVLQSALPGNRRKRERAAATDEPAIQPRGRRQR